MYIFVVQQRIVLARYWLKICLEKHKYLGASRQHFCNIWPVEEVWDWGRPPAWLSGKIVNFSHKHWTFRIFSGFKVPHQEKLWFFCTLTSSRGFFYSICTRIFLISRGSCMIILRSNQHRDFVHSFKFWQDTTHIIFVKWAEKSVNSASYSGWRKVQRRHYIVFLPNIAILYTTCFRTGELKRHPGPYSRQ